MAKWRGNNYKRPANRANPPRPAKPTRANQPAPPDQHGANSNDPAKPSKRGPNRANQPTGGQPPTDQPTPPDQITGINRGQTTGAKRLALTNSTGPTNDPQTGQSINPGPTTANPKQPRKQAFEVSTYQLSKAKKTPV